MFLRRGDILYNKNGIPYEHLLRWGRDSERILKEENHLPVMDLKRRMRSKKRLTILLGSAFFVLSWIREHGSGDSHENWMGYLIVVTVYKSRFHWIIQQTEKCYPKDMSKWWEVMKLEVPETLSVLSDGVNISWYRYQIKKAESGTEETGEVIAADERTAQELQKEQDAVRKAEEEPVQGFLEPLLKQ